MGLVSPGGHHPHASQGAYQQPPRNYDDQQASNNQVYCDSLCCADVFSLSAGMLRHNDTVQMLLAQCALFTYNLVADLCMALTLLTAAGLFVRSVWCVVMLMLMW